MPEITFRLFEAFDAVAKHRSISQAARALYVTQSAITHSVKKLEKACGVILIRPTRKGIELTEAGEQILTKVELLLSLRKSVVNDYKHRTDRDGKTVLHIRSFVIFFITIGRVIDFVL